MNTTATRAPVVVPAHGYLPKLILSPGRPAGVFKTPTDRRSVFRHLVAIPYFQGRRVNDVGSMECDVMLDDTYRQAGRPAWLPIEAAIPLSDLTGPGGLVRGIMQEWDWPVTPRQELSVAIRNWPANVDEVRLVAHFLVAPQRWGAAS